MKKIEGVVVYYDDGSRERLSAEEIMARFFSPVPRQESNEELRLGEPTVTEPEKTIQSVAQQVGNVSFRNVEHSPNSPPAPEDHHSGNPIHQSLSESDKDYRAATIRLFPYGGERLRNQTLMTCIMEDRAFMEKVAQNTKGKNAELSRQIRLVLDRNPEKRDN